MFGLFKRRAPEPAAPESRSDVVSITNATPSGFLQLIGGDVLSGQSAGEPVTVESALGVPAVFAAVNFLSSSLASLPVHVYARADDGTERRAGGALEALLNEAPNDTQSAYDWRKYSYDQTFTGGRQVSFIERNTAGRIISIWPLDPSHVTIERSGGVKRYRYRDGSRAVVYDAADVLDLPFMLKADGLAHRSPIMANAEVISLAIAVTKYGGAWFRGGGVPPFVVEGNFQSPGAMQRAADNMSEAVAKAAREKRQALVLPQGLTVKSIGSDPEKAQLVETQRFMIQQIARIYSLPPVFLQDLTDAKYANVEQQDLHLVKHTLRAWVKQWEGELNLKLFGRLNRRQFVRVNLDGILRGDFKTRMEGYASGIQHGVMTPNEARALEGRDALPGGEGLYIQGAMVPIQQAGRPDNAGNGGTDEP